MSEAYQFLALVLGVWFACFIQSHRLFYKFRAKYPEIAQREIPRAFETCEHPEKLLFFLASSLFSCSPPQHSHSPQFTDSLVAVELETPWRGPSIGPV